MKTISFDSLKNGKIGTFNLTGCSAIFLQLTHLRFIVDKMTAAIKSASRYNIFSLYCNVASTKNNNYVVQNFIQNIHIPFATYQLQHTTKPLQIPTQNVHPHTDTNSDNDQTYLKFNS